MPIQKAQKENLVVKSNRLIEASYRLTLTEQQLILFAIVRSREEQKGLFSDLPITIRAADFAKQFNTNSETVYRDLQNALKNLFNRFVVIHDIHPESGAERKKETRWISEASYVNNAGLVEFIFAPAVIPFITRLEKEFTTYRISQIGNMTSIYAVRIYELLVQYLSIGKRELTVGELKKTLELEDEYSRILDLKIRVIDVAMKQINEHTDIDVSYEQIKTGRFVTSFIFSIKKKKPKKEEKPKKQIVDKHFVEKNARPGESYDQAYRRLLEEINGQKRLIE
jgi:plasmid replication initiation protein